jgi:nitric oxide synthase oxygenase domain/subunit
MRFILNFSYEWFQELDLKWYCVPAVSSMMLDIGGIQFTACPFNGWYMVTEIGRDLADINRYNKLPLIACKMGLDIGTNTSLWKDKALLELNYAILNSYQVCNLL